MSYTMRPAEFDYHRPTDLAEAIALLGGGGEVRPLAGGHSLLPLMKLRLATPTALVDLGRIPGLDAIAWEGNSVRIGALATHAAVAASDLVHESCPVLAETAAGIGDRQVRNRGTFGGSVAHADPGADYPTVLTALGATIVAQGAGGEREIAADDFFVGIFETALQPGELVTSVVVPVSGGGTGAAYAKHAHPASGYAVVGAAAVVAVSGGTCSSVRVAIGGAVPSPVRATGVEESLTGSAPSTEAIAAAAEQVAASLPQPTGDTYASAEYRVQLAKVLAKRALAAAVDRAG
jgi:aerobic carbon-monoxide dehydrogenase medium subunit